VRNLSARCAADVVPLSLDSNQSPAMLSPVDGRRRVQHKNKDNLDSDDATSAARFKTRVGTRMTYLENSRLLGSRPIGLPRRCDGRDWLQIEGNDLGTDHFTRDDQLDTAVLLTALGSIV
jgi:hypothetical protein